MVCKVCGKHYTAHSGISVMNNQALVIWRSCGDCWTKAVESFPTMREYFKRRREMCDLLLSSADVIDTAAPGLSLPKRIRALVEKVQTIDAGLVIDALAE